VFDDSVLEWQSKNGGLGAVKQISPADAANERGAQIIDVRGASEWEEGHVPGAMHIPLPDLADRMADLPDGPLVLHCQGGTRSVIAASLLLAAGRQDVTNMDGGYAAWRRAGLPIATAESDAEGERESVTR
jgi:rhodanese-related sulfurtransferase